MGHIYGLKEEQAKPASSDLIPDDTPRKSQQEAQPMSSVAYEAPVRVVRQPYQTTGIRGKQPSGTGKNGGRQDIIKSSVSA